MLISSAAETTEGVFNQYTAGEFGLYSIIGFLIVIAVLVVLIVLLIVFSKILNAVTSVKVTKKNKEVKAEDMAVVADDTETVAAITAALMAYYDVQTTANGEDDDPVPFIIRSIKKI